LSPLFDESLNEFPTPLEAVDRSELIRLQHSDPDHTALFDLVNKVEHAYTICARFLVRAWRDKLFPQEATFHQIVVPTAYAPNYYLSLAKFQLLIILELLRPRIVCCVIFIVRASPKVRKSFVAAVTFANVWARVRQTLHRHYTVYL